MKNIEPSEEWCEIAPDSILPGAQPVLSPTRTRTWALVLAARSVPHQSIRKGWGWALRVPCPMLAQAEEEIRIFEEKNRFWPPRTAPTRTGDNLLLSLSILLLLGVFHNLTLLPGALEGIGREQWLEMGALHVRKVLDGEWWRLVTALTLHADWLHLLGNLSAGAIFIGRLCQIRGAGWGWLLVVLSGAGGNLLNTLMQSPTHRAVGASTAIFGAVGLLCARAVRRGGRHLNGRRLLPFAAGLALLAMLGSEGEKTDLGAHLWGFACGILLGAIRERGEGVSESRRTWRNTAAGILALVLVLACWARALGA